MGGSMVRGSSSMRPIMTAAVSLGHVFFRIKESKLNKIYTLTILTRLPRSRQTNGREPSAVAVDTARVDENEVCDYYCNHADTDQLIKIDPVEQKSLLPNVDSRLRNFYRLELFLVSIMVVKYFVLCLFDLDSLRNHRYLTCYVFGRLLVNGRTTKLTSQVALYVTFFVLVWRVIIHVLRPSLRLDCVEFQLHDYDEVLLQNTKSATFKESLSAGDRGLEAAEVWDKRTARGPSSFLAEAKWSQSSSACTYNTLLQFRNQFIAQPSQKQQHQQLANVLEQQLCFIKPNRTPEAWLRLAAFTRSFFMGSYLAVLLTLPLFLRMTMPVLLTKRGFELSYSQCAEWIDGHNDTSMRHIHMEPQFYDRKLNSTYRFTRSLVFLPFRDFCQMSWYHAIRMPWDVLENLIIYMDTAHVFIMNTFFGLLVVADVELYTDSLQSDLTNLIEQMKVRQLLRQEKALAEPRSRRPSTVQKNRRLDLNLNQRILTIQSMLIDYFNLIRAYDMYATVFVLFTILAWMVYSAMVSSWIFIPSELTDAPKLEWYILHLFATVYIVGNMGAFARLRNRSRSINPLITTAASLDDDYCLRKGRWLTILRYYSPSRPMYCFTLFKSSELSWLFLLKLFAWLFSALLVGSSFFDHYSRTRLI